MVSILQEQLRIANLQSELSGAKSKVPNFITVFIFN